MKACNHACNPTYDLISGTGGTTQTLPLELKDLIASGVPVVTLALLLVSAPPPSAPSNLWETEWLSRSSDCLHTYAEELSDLGQGTQFLVAHPSHLSLLRCR